MPNGWETVKILFLLFLFFFLLGICICSLFSTLIFCVHFVRQTGNICWFNFIQFLFSLFVATLMKFKLLCSENKFEPLSNFLQSAIVTAEHCLRCPSNCPSFISPHDDAAALFAPYASYTPLWPTTSTLRRALNIFITWQFWLNSTQLQTLKINTLRRRCCRRRFFYISANLMPLPHCWCHCWHKQKQ